MLHGIAPRDLEHVERAGDVGVDIGARIIEAVTHAGLRREMHDHVRLRRLCDGREPLLVREHRHVRGEAVRLRQNLVALFLQLHVVIGREPIDARHRMAVGEQALRKMEADKTGGAGDQKTQNRSPVIPGRAIPPSGRDNSGPFTQIQTGRETPLIANAGAGKTSRAGALLRA